MMKYIIPLISSLALMSTLAQGEKLNEQGSDAQKNPVIEVFGEAIISVAPSALKMIIRLEDQSRNISKAKMLVEQKSKQINQMAGKVSIQPKNMQWQPVIIRPLYKTDDIQVQALEVPQNFYQGKEAKVFLSADVSDTDKDIDKFEVSRELVLSFSDQQQYQRFLEYVSKLGIKSVFPAAIAPEELQHYYQQALDKAILNATKKARHVAQQTGTKIGALFSLKELPLADDTKKQRYYLSPDRMNSDKIQQEIRARVIASYKIIP